MTPPSAVRLSVDMDPKPSKSSMTGIHITKLGSSYQGLVRSAVEDNVKPAPPWIEKLILSAHVSLCAL